MTQVEVDFRPQNLKILGNRARFPHPLLRDNVTWTMAFRVHCLQNQIARRDATETNQLDVHCNDHFPCFSQLLS
ncbi:hypothetical protein SERLA73DRAFT_140536 [Serpula lacrymans var. lacrymans S7.3]|uniref:Uncharacterized protein n=1 Tax=Serpula lacrymans var. lacrymans (strain S7.3) TaxID=936435 RepID=F8Q3T1_SERL3|nr:hypothetical protein SERLA73DRAFT_140536 [Serpula lacrymans var. lacrymans S7.3]